MHRFVPVVAAALWLAACAPQTIIANNQQAVIESWSQSGAVARAEQECGKRGRWPLLQRQGVTEYWFACNETEATIAARQKAAQDAALKHALEMNKAMAAAKPQPAKAPAPAAPVWVPVPAKSPTPGATVKRNARDGRWVQLGAFRDKATAEKYVAKIRKAHAGVVAGHEVVLSEANLGARGTFVVARLGPYARATEARGACGSLKARGAACFVAAKR